VFVVGRTYRREFLLHHLVRRQQSADFGDQEIVGAGVEHGSRLLPQITEQQTDHFGGAELLIFVIHHTIDIYQP